MTYYAIECPNCGCKIDLSEFCLTGEDEYFGDCCECDYPYEIEIERDDDGFIIDLHVY